MKNRKIHRSRDEADGVCRFMQFARLCRIGAGSYGDLGTQGCALKRPRTVFGLLHYAFRMVFVGNHYNAGYGTEMQICKLMAGG